MSSAEPISSNHTLTMYGASGCCLCDDAKAVLTPLSERLDFRLAYVEIDGDPRLEAAYREQIPVGFLDGHKVFKYRVDVPLLERRLTRRAQPATPGLH